MPDVLEDKTAADLPFEKLKNLSKSIQDRLVKQGSVLQKRSFPNTILNQNKK